MTYLDAYDLTQCLGCYNRP